MFKNVYVIKYLPNEIIQLPSEPFLSLMNTYIDKQNGLQSASSKVVVKVVGK